VKKGNAKQMTRKLIALLVAIAFVGACNDGEPEATKTIGSGYKVARLFTHNGCTIYRFYDEGNYRYFTNCTSTFGSTRRQSGKTVIHVPDEIITTEQIGDDSNK
jgi:hypothetical protein